MPDPNSDDGKTTDQTKATQTAAADAAGKGADAVTKDADSGKAADKQSASLLNGNADDKTATAPADWPADWREKMAGGDEKELARLKRFKSPLDANKSWRAAEQRITSGELKAGLKEGATEAELAQWRKDNGIPETPDKYEVKLEGGLIIGEDDKPMVDDFLKTAHGKNWLPGQVNDALGWYFAQQDKMLEERDRADLVAKQEAEDALRSEWGNEYRPNLVAVENLLNAAPDAVKANLLGGRLADGTPITANADTVRWLAGLALEINPAATTVPGSGGSGQQLADRKAELQKLMGDKQSDYWKGPKAEALQAEYRKISEAEERQQKRRAA